MSNMGHDLCGKNDLLFSNVYVLVANYIFNCFGTQQACFKDFQTLCLSLEVYSPDIWSL